MFRIEDTLRILLSPSKVDYPSLYWGSKKPSRRFHMRFMQ